MAANSRTQVRRTKGSVILRPAPARGRSEALERSRGTNLSEARRDREEASDAVEDLTATSLDKVRELLFGQELRKNDQRFSRIEERLVKELTALGSDTKKRLDALDSMSRAEIDGLTKTLRVEASERETLGKELARTLQEVAKSIDKKIAQMDAQFVKALRETQAELTGEMRALREEMKQAIDESKSELSAQARQIQGQKLDRGQLASLLIGLAQSLEKDKSAR